MSLKNKLNQAIKLRGSMSFQEVKEMTEELGYKLSNAERRLRESPDIEKIKKNGTIIAYKWKTDRSYFETKPEPKKEKLAFGDTKTIYEMRYKK